MREEISAAVIFLARLLEKGENFNQRQLEEFKARLSELLTERFENHWFPDFPQKGQGYRCIRVNEHSRRDISLEKAARACGIKYEDMKLPVELTIWVDPNEVCCRFGENKGSYCTLASFNDKENLIEVSEEIKEILEAEIKDMAAESDRESDKPECAAAPAETKPAAEAKTEKQEEKETAAAEPAAPPAPTTKPQVTPLAASNSRQPQHQQAQHSQHSHHHRKYPQGSPKQKSGPRRNNMGGGYPPHPHHAPWYNIISPHWMSPSPPPYHPMLRRQGAPLPPHPRYHWPNKSMLKV